MTICSVCGVILRSDSESIFPRPTLCFYHHLDDLTRGNYTTPHMRTIFARLDKGWRGQADRQRLAKLKSESEARLYKDIAQRWGSGSWRALAFTWIQTERNKLRRQVEGIEAVNWIEQNSIRGEHDIAM